MTVALVVAVVACVLVLAGLVVALEVIHQRQQQRLLRALYALRFEPAERVALTNLEEKARPRPRVTVDSALETVKRSARLNQATYKANGDLDVAPVDA